MKQLLLVCLYIWCFSITLISSTQAFQFAVISDVQTAALDKALEFITSQDVNLVLLPGDFFNDAQDYYSHFVKFGLDVSPGKAPNQQAVYFIIGNHDLPPAGGYIFRKAALCYPKNGPVHAPQGTIFSFDRDECHFVITNQYWDCPNGGYTDAQLKWIEQDLKASDRNFKFVFGHEPAFPLSRHENDSLDADPARRDRFWHILKANGAQAFFCGHTHNLSHVLQKGVYQIDIGKVDDNGPICVTLVDVKRGKATVKSYQTNGSLPEMNDLVIQTRMDAKLRPVATDGPEVLFSAEEEGLVGKLRSIRSFLIDRL
jgi:3',5'-cyclic AMP phosphodiesterase CpdA